MNQSQKISLFILRISMGWLFLYAGVTKLIDPTWSSAGYIGSAKTFASFYQWLLSPSLLTIVNLVNEWGLTLLGISLILGVAVRISSILGAVLMMMYYFVILQFPYPNPHSYIVDEHIIYALVLVFLAAMRAGKIWGIGSMCKEWPLCKTFPSLHNWLD